MTSAQSEFKCMQCTSTFGERKNLLQHEQTVHGEVYHKCELCHTTFNRVSNLKRHKKNIHMKQLAEGNNSRNNTTTKPNQDTSHNNTTTEPNQDTSHNYKKPSEEATFKCILCTSTFTQNWMLLRHERTVHGDVVHKCELCNASFNRLSNLMRHRIIHNKHKAEKNIFHSDTITQPNTYTSHQYNKRPAEESNYHNDTKRVKIIDPKPCDLHQHTGQKCNWCGHNKELAAHKPFCVECSKKGRECRNCHRPLPERYYNREVNVCDACCTKRNNFMGRLQSGAGQTSLGGVVEIQKIIPSEQNMCDPLIFLAENKTKISNYLEENIEDKQGIKWSLTLQVKFDKIDGCGQIMTSSPHFLSEINISTTPNVTEQLANSFKQLYNRMENFEHEGSGWTINQIIKLEIKLATYSPISGSSYFELPKKLLDKKALLNIQNNDNFCFKWSVLAHLYPVPRKDQPHRVSHYSQYESSLDWSMMSFPTPLNDIKQFEKKNNISINVFGWEKSAALPLHITKFRQQTHINLLLISDGDKRHFCLIKNMSRLLADRTKHNGETHYCDSCLHGFNKQELLNSHIPYCSTNAPQKVILPNDDEKYLKFKNHANGLKIPFTIYADFECFLQSYSENTKQTEKYQKHVTSGFSYVVVSSVEKYNKQAVVYRGENAMDEFFKHLDYERKYITDILSEIVPMQLTPEEESTFHNAEICHICEKVLKEDRVRDHDHLTGQYRGAAHNSCNLNFKFSKENQQKPTSFHIPVILHNFQGYDSHLIMESLGKNPKSRLSCIPKNIEKYLSFSQDNFRFIDSLQFMNSSLNELVSNLANDNMDKFKILKKHFPDPQKLKLTTRKGVFPYDYITDSSKFLEKQLPSQKDFYNTLNEEKLPNTDYDHAKHMWQTFNIQNLGEYHDLYLKTDVLLLADVFENFRDMCLNCYKLDAAHYITAPGLAWDAMLRMTGVTLELLTDIDMHLMVERGIRGGISMISNRYSKANNKYQDDYDPLKPSKYITYLDANNLYGWAMSQSLPYGEFKWLTDDQISSFCVNNISDESEHGYFLDVDLEYPENLHDRHSDYPLAPESMIVTDEMLSPFSQKLKENLQVKGKPTPKLIPNLHKKTNYIVHYRNLKFYLQQGMIVTKIHRIIQFKQSPWLKGYIDFNTDMRRNATSNVEKNLFKLMNNSVFGKTMENLRNRVNVELVNSPKRLKKICANPSFNSFRIFNENLTAVHSLKTRLFLNRPIYVGFAVLDGSKLLMYDFHYIFIINKYGDRAKLLFTDTDSLCYEIQTYDLYRDMMDDQHLYDTSGYKKDHFLYNPENKNVLGKMKDECSGTIIDEFVGLRSKMYSLSYDGKEKKTAKGVKRRVVEFNLRHQCYKDCLLNSHIQYNTMNQIRSYNHEVFSVAMKKISLSPYDDKRYVTENGFDTLAHGHYKTK